MSKKKSLGLLTTYTGMRDFREFSERKISLDEFKSRQPSKETREVNPEQEAQTSGGRDSKQ